MTSVFIFRTGRQRIYAGQHDKVKRKSGRAAPEMFFPMIESQHKRLELDWLNTRWIVELGIVDSGADRVRLHLIRTIRHQ